MGFTYYITYSGNPNSDSKTCFNIEQSSPDEEKTEVQSICKETCSEDDCNDQLTDFPGDGGNPISEHFCYSCTVTVNHLNQTIGNGDISCWHDPREENAIQCPAGENFCITDLEVDWTGRGDQYATISRVFRFAECFSHSKSGIARSN